jgi:competence protein ComEC
LQAQGLVGAVRQRAERAIEHELHGDQAALLEGVALGDDSRLSNESKLAFRRASLTHVTAASGQNVALMLALLLPILAMLGLGFRTRLVLAAVAIVGYVPLAGGQPPIQRAAVMGMAVLAARWRGGRAAPVHALLLAGAVTCAWDPSAPLSVGWQLSFAAVGGMLLLGPAFSGLLARLGLPGPLCEALSATAAATLATSPLIAGFAGRLSLVAIPANLIAAPAVAVAMWLGMIASVAGQIGWLAAAPFADVASIPVSAVLETATIFSAPSWAAVSWHPTPTTVVLLLAALAAGGLLLRSVDGRADQSPA